MHQAYLIPSLSLKNHFNEIILNATYTIVGNEISQSNPWTKPSGPWILGQTYCLDRTNWTLGTDKRWFTAWRFVLKGFEKWMLFEVTNDTFDFSIKWSACSLWSSPLYSPKRNSGQMTIGKTHSTLISFATGPDWYSKMNLNLICSHLAGLNSLKIQFLKIFE